MAMVRLVAGLAVITACYRDADPRPPEPTTVAGPPSGQIDPDASIGHIEDSAAVAPVTDDEIARTLAGYGEWISIDSRTDVWRPYATVVGVDFTPYETCGSWVWTEIGWTFACEWSWGWLPFHYGRWGWFGEFWAWMPAREWSPAWVEWRSGGGYIGWRPLAPATPRAKQMAGHWRFMTEDKFGKPRIRAHLYKVPAVALRVTASAQRPALRPNVQPVRVASVMHAREAMRR